MATTWPFRNTLPATVDIEETHAGPRPDEGRAMKAVVVREPGRFDVADVATPQPARGQVEVAVESAGICGTDLKILEGSIPVGYPRVLGHEVIGRVTQDVPAAGVAARDRVLIDPFSACGVCPTCLADRTHLCPNGALMGRDTDGGLAERVAVEPSRLIPVPDTVGPAAAASLQVFGTCVHAQSRIHPLPGEVGVVTGLGVSGLLHLQLLRARGVEVIGITRSQEKRALASQLGAAAVAHPDDAEALVAEHTHGRGADIVVECAGAPAALAQAIRVAGLGATMLLFGITPKADDLPLYQLYFKELDLINARAARPRDYRRAAELAAAGVIELEPLLSASHPLAEAEAAFDQLKGSAALKVTLEVAT